MVILIYLALLAALWVAHNVRQVRREKRRAAGLAPATGAGVYDGNLVIPPPTAGRSGHPRGVVGHSGSGGHSVHEGHGHAHIAHGGHDIGMGHMGPGGHH